MKISNKIKKISKVLIYVFTFGIFILPVISFSAGLVPCSEPNECNWYTLMALVNNVVDFVLFKLAIPIAAIMFAYAGILLLTSGGDTGKMTKAKELFTGVAIGLIIAAAAWLIVNTILSILGYSGSWIGFN